MSKTHTLPAGTMNTLASALDACHRNPAAADAMFEEIAKAQPIKLSITEILGDADPTIRSNLLDSFVSSINMSLLAQCRSEVMFGTHKVSEAPTWQEFDKHLEAQELDANARAFAAMSGGKERPIPSKVAENLGKLRAFALKAQYEANTSRAPRPLWESMAWLIDQLPTEASPSDPAIKVIALMTKKTPEVVVALRNELYRTEKEKLIAAAPKIIGLAEQFSDEVVDAEIAEQAFDALPGITQVNLYTSACNALVSVHARAFKQVLRGRAAAAGDMTIAEAMYRKAVPHREHLKQRFSAEIADYEERGSQLKELKRIS